MDSPPTDSKPRRVVVLGAAAPGVETLRALLGERCEIVFAPSLDRAVDALRGDPAAQLLVAGGIDPVGCDCVERLGQGLCLLSAEGELRWANATAQAYGPEAKDALRAAFRDLAAAQAADPGRVHRRTVTAGREQQFDLAAALWAPVAERTARSETDPPPSLLVLIWDSSHSRRMQARINAIDSAGSALMRLDAGAIAQLDVGERLRLLEENILRFSRELLHFDHLVIRVLDRKDNRLDTVVAGGLSEEAKALRIFAQPEGNGISGFVAATGQAYLCPDVSKDPRYLPGLEQARSTLTVPLRLHDQIVGVFNVESETLNAFSEEDLQMAEIFGRYVALALHMLQLLVVERRATTGQIAADVAAEVSRPLNDIAAAVTALQGLSAASAPEVRYRLDAILRSVDQVKEGLAAVTDPGPITGLRSDAPVNDPVLAGKRILVADDEDIIRETVAEVLAKSGAQIFTASDGDEAVRLVSEQPFDLVLSDIKMPTRNGYEVFSAARVGNPLCPVILMTGFGYDPNHSIVRASKEGLAGVLFKPFKVDQLLAEIRQALSEG